MTDISYDSRGGVKGRLEGDECDVVIVGAGPVGATAALLLADYGVQCLVVEARHSPQSHPAAHVLSTRSLEIWRQVGLDHDILDMSAPPADMQTIPYCTTLAGRELGQVPLIDDLSDEQRQGIDSISPTRHAHLPQNELEPFLWSRLRESRHIDFRTESSYESHTDTCDGIAVRIIDTTTGSSRTVRARYLIAADGAASTVRRALRVTMEGPVLQHVISVHFAADLEKYRRHRRGPLIWTYNPKGVGALIIHRPPRDLVFQIPYFPPIESLADFTVDSCRRHIVDAIGDPNIDVDIKSIQSWTMHAQVAARYRVGRVFLVGDAAHRFPPTGGLGLNTGVADVHNLAWKLAWVLKGRAQAGLLNTYERERRPIGVEATVDSVANFEGLFDVVAALGVPRKAIRLLPQIISAVPAWAPRPLLRVLLRALTSLAYQRFRVAALPGPLGRRTRNRAAAAIAGGGSHYRSWGRDLGVRYIHGAVVADKLPPPPYDPQFYTPRARAGGRLPHAWHTEGDRQISTLDMVRPDTLTLLVSQENHGLWVAAAAGLPLTVVPINAIDTDVFSSGVPSADPDALVVRPDGHIAALLHSGQHEVALLRHTLTVVGATLPVRKGSAA